MNTEESICLGIVGYRNFTDREMFETIVEDWIEKNGKPSIIVSGGANGVDTLAREYAIKHGYPLEEYHADWSTYGKSAGPVRNTKIATVCTHILALPSRSGKGTQDTIQKAQKLNKEVTIHYID